MPCALLSVKLLVVSDCVQLQTLSRSGLYGELAGRTVGRWGGGGGGCSATLHSVGTPQKFYKNAAELVSGAPGNLASSPLKMFDFSSIHPPLSEFLDLYWILLPFTEFSPKFSLPPLPKN